MKDFKKWLLTLTKGTTPQPPSSQTNRDTRLLVASGAAPAEVIRRESAPVAGASQLLRNLAAINAELSGFGSELASLLQDPQVTDVLINGPQQVWVDSGGGLCKTKLNFGSPGNLRTLAVRLAGAAGKRLDDAAPIADGTLPGGIRL
ncbi:MAG: hypothetical protein E7E19_08070, partial [Varibaculum cambriense]|nr:hypothetical protein [Varibaculum cambriense]